jgi:ubiquinone/menaquinone biosynthesis C-methylase UbiE
MRESDPARPGLQFDQVAEAYDEHRPTYPEELIDAACAAAGLQPGDPVLEVGCGTGQLTSALVRRGLAVVAVDPGPNMIERARARVEPNAVRFVRGRFEDAVLPEAGFAAVFSGSAFHWLDPEVSWAKAASVLRAGGTLTLIQYCGVADPDTSEQESAFRRSLERLAPEIAATFPRARDAESTLAGARERSANVSDVWSWVGQHELAVPGAAELYEEATVFSCIVRDEWTTEKLNAHLRTTSLAFRLGPDRTAALEAENERTLASRGGRFPLTFLAVAVTARRARG